VDLDLNLAGVPVTLSRYLDVFELQLYDSAVHATETNFLAELERVDRGERPTVDPRALLFVAAEVILEGRKADERDLERLGRASAQSCKVLVFPSCGRESAG
jgi:hypothetical protein